MNARYEGMEDERTITSSDFASLGVTHDDVTWAGKGDIVELSQEAFDKLVELGEKIVDTNAPEEPEAPADPTVEDLERIKQEAEAAATPDAASGGSKAKAKSE